MLFAYLFKLYAKHLFIILSALVLFFVAFDYILTVKKLPGASNLQLLYVSFKFMEALETLWQLSMVFAFLTTWMRLVKTNTVVSLYALGYGKKDLLLPFVTVFVIMYVLMTAVQMTEFSYAKDKAGQIRSHGTLTTITNDMFFKYDDSYVYFKKMQPLQKTATSVRIFETSGQHLQIIQAQEAYFEDNSWVLPQATLQTIEEGRVVHKQLNNYRTLHEFKPKILESVYEAGTGFSLRDALSALTMLQTQGVNTKKIRAILYNKLLQPFFVLLLILIFFQKLPLHPRFVNLSFALTVSIVTALFVWGVLFGVFRVTLSSGTTPEMLMLTPLVVLLGATLYLFKPIKITN
ncbi:MAG: LptF/LptG family permease [Campylobacterota bacterium]